MIPLSASWHPLPYLIAYTYHTATTYYYGVRICVTCENEPRSGRRGRFSQIRKESLMSTTDFSDIVGVFRDRSQADEAVDELKQAGFADDEIQLTEYELQRAVEVPSTSPSLQSPNNRI